MIVPGKEKVFVFILRQNAEKTHPVFRHSSPQLLLSRDIHSFLEAGRDVIQFAIEKSPDIEGPLKKFENFNEKMVDINFLTI